MSLLPKRESRFFKECGRRGGQKRASKLSSSARSAIASKAAKARWGEKKNHVDLMPSIRIDEPDLSDPTYVEELLSEGTFKDWRHLYLEISNRPFDKTAEALERVLASSKMYGITPLWRGILSNVRGNFP